MPLCSGCGKWKRTEEALLQHIWSKEYCKERASVYMMEKLVEAERDYNQFHCPNPNCRRKLADVAEALKAHAFQKVECRFFIPIEMAKLIQDEEEEFKAWESNGGDGRIPCPNPECRKRIAPYDESLKQHAAGKKQCREYLPLHFLNQIREEEGTAKEEYVWQTNANRYKDGVAEGCGSESWGAWPYGAGEWSWVDSQGHVWARQR